MIIWFLGVAVTEHGPGMLVSRNWGSAAGPLKCRGRLSLAGVAQGLCVSAFGFWARPRFGRRSLNTVPPPVHMLVCHWRLGSRFIIAM
jgi:hypothetical protein